MKIVDVKKILILDFDSGYSEFEEGEWVDLLMQDGSTACGDIVEIKTDSVILNDDVLSNEGIEIPFDEIAEVL